VITVLGSPDSVFGYFVADPSESFDDALFYRASGFLQTSALAAYRTPPDDSVWYPIRDFLVNSFTIDLDFMDKERSHADFKPVYHGTLDGSIRPRLSQPYSPSFRGDDYSVFKVDSGIVSPSLTLMARSVVPYGGISSMYLSDLDDDVGEHGAKPGDTILSGYLYGSSLAGANVAGSDWVGNLTVFDSSREVPKTGSTFINEGTVDYCNSFGSAVLPRSTGVSHCQSSRHFKWMATLTHIRNIDGILFVKGLCNCMSEVTHWSDNTKETLHTSFPFASTLRTNRQFWPGNIPFNKTKRGFRRLCDLSLDSEKLAKSMVNRRTISLNKIEDLETNNVENLAGVAELLEVVGQIVQIWKGIESLNPLLVIKALANAVLLWKFVFESTYSDAKSIKEKGPGLLHRLAGSDLVRLRKSAGEYDYDSPFFNASKVKLASEFILTRNLDLESIVIDALDSSDLLPTLSRDWDLVPMSFVIDWFVNIGDTLDALSRQYGDSQHYTLVKRVESQKLKFSLDQKLVGVLFNNGWVPTGKSKGRLYRRSLFDDWGQFDAFSLAGGSGLHFTQWVEGVSIFIQKI